MADGPMPLLGFTFLQDCEGEMVFRGEGGSLWRKAKSLLGDRGTRESHRISCNLLLDAALPGEPALLRLQDQTPCRHLSKHRGENHKGKEENLYIYII